MSSTSSGRVQVWDPLVRLFHGALVAGMAWEYLSEAGTALHARVGQTILALVAVRVVWGFIGPRHARFADFVPSPGRLAGYLKDLARGHPQRYLGHNPAGGVWIIVLLTLITFTAVAGWGADIRFPDNQSWEDGHETLASLTLVAIGVHLSGVLVSSLLHRENLVRSMITGIKRS